MSVLFYQDRTKASIDAMVKSSISAAPIVFDRSSKVHYVRIGCGFDTETSTLNLQGALVGYCYHWQMSIGNLTILGRYLRLMQDLFSTLIESLGDNRMLVWDANLGYEWQYCKHYWNELGISGLFGKTERNPLRVIVGDKIELRECIGLFGKSLDDIANNYTQLEKKKGDLDYEKVRLSITPLTEKEIKYTVADVEILRELGNYVFEHYFNNGEKLAFTKTGFIRNKIKKRFGKFLKSQYSKIKSWMPTEDEYTLFRNFLMKGGWCGSNAYYLELLLENIICADLTSDYPAVMFQKKYPMGKPIECAPEEFNTEKIPYIIKVVLRDVKSRNTHSFISAHKCLNKKDVLLSPESIIDNGRIWQAKEVYMCLNEIELATIQKMYDIGSIEIITCWKFEKYGYLPKEVTDVIKEEYLNKERLKREGKQDTLEYKASKEVVNGIFGMMLTALYLDEMELDDDLVIQMNNCKRYEDAINNLFLSPFWGMWVTTYARDILVDIVSRFPDVVIQYDTDSIYFSKDSKEYSNLIEYINEFNSKVERFNHLYFRGDNHFADLGCWDIEKPFKRFKGLGAKRYMYEKQSGEIKVVIAGCRKKDKVSTLVLQARDNGVEPFEFFKDGMLIDEEHSNKKATSYVEVNSIPVERVKYTDYLGNEEEVELSSSAVLFPIQFKMGMAPTYEEIVECIRIWKRNTPH